MHWRGVVLVASAAAGVVVACSDDEGQAPVTYPTQGDGGATASSSSSSGGSSSGTLPTISHDYCGIAIALVDKILSCCTEETKASRGDGNYSFAKAIYQGYVCPTIEGALASGRIRVDEKAEATCIGNAEAILAKMTCPYHPTPADTDSLAAEACSKVYAGTVAESGACRGDHECVDGLTCVGWNATTDGTCKSPPALGEPCGAGPASDGGANVLVELPFGQHSKCAPGGYCAADRKCAAQAAQGEFCGGDSMCANGLKCFQDKCGGPGPSDENGPCLSSDDCKEDLYCTSRDAGACKPKKAPGETCSKLQGDCRSNCDVPDGGTTGTCVSYCYE